MARLCRDLRESRLVMQVRVEQRVLSGCLELATLSHTNTPNLLCLLLVGSRRSVEKPHIKDQARKREKLSQQQQQAAAAAAAAPAAMAGVSFSAPASAPMQYQPQQTVEPPNKILFVQNLPEETNQEMLSMLFSQYVILSAGLYVFAWKVPSRMFPGTPPRFPLAP